MVQTQDQQRDWRGLGKLLRINSLQDRDNGGFVGGLPKPRERHHSTARMAVSPSLPGPSDLETQHVAVANSGVTIETAVIQK